MNSHWFATYFNSRMVRVYRQPDPESKLPRNYNGLEKLSLSDKIQLLIRSGAVVMYRHDGRICVDISVDATSTILYDKIRSMECWTPHITTQLNLLIARSNKHTACYYYSGNNADDLLAGVIIHLIRIALRNPIYQFTDKLVVYSQYLEHDYFPTTLSLQVSSEKGQGQPKLDSYKTMLQFIVCLTFKQDPAISCQNERQRADFKLSFYRLPVRLQKYVPNPPKHSGSIFEEMQHELWL